MIGGVVFRIGEAWHFVAATVAREVLASPETTRVPGAPPELLGLALVAGAPLPIVDIRWHEPSLRGGSRPPLRTPSAMLVCTYLGERVGFVGLEIVRTGCFEASADGGVIFEGRAIPMFDVGPVVVALRERRWAV